MRWIRGITYWTRQCQIRFRQRGSGAAIGRLKQNPATKHLPVVAFGADKSPDLQAAAQAAGAALVTGEAAILNHLPEILDQALQME